MSGRAPTAVRVWARPPVADLDQGPIRVSRSSVQSDSTALARDVRERAVNRPQDPQSGEEPVRQERKSDSEGDEQPRALGQSCIAALLRPETARIAAAPQ